MLSHAQAKRFYDKFGSKQDAQSFYEGPALRELARHLRLEACHAIVEFGCGTGRFAEEMLAEHVSPDATYLGFDVSDTMVALAAARLTRFAERASVRKSDGAPRIDGADGTCDRFISTYVLDLLSDDEIRDIVREAHRVLRAGGLIGLVSMTNGPTPASRLISTIWKGVHGLSPGLVGGCRPIEIRGYLPPVEWTIEHRSIATPFGVPSEIVVATRR